MNVLAIDQGTSATKALVVAAGGRILGEGSAPVHPRPGPGGAVEQDPHELLHSMIAAGRAALDAAGAPVGAVGIANQGETVMRWDRRTGETFGPALSWLRRAAGPGGVITTVDAWLNHQVTGTFATDAATASRLLLLDLETMR